MVRLKFAPTVSVLCSVLMLVACGGDGDSTTAVNAHPSPTQKSLTSSSTSQLGVEASPRAMAGFANLGNTCYANSALKLAIHSIGPDSLKLHLNEFALALNTPPLQREAALDFVALIDKSYSDNGPTEQELAYFFTRLQQLPAFQSKDSAGQLTFPIMGVPQDVSAFLSKLSESFALHTTQGFTLALRDGNNQFNTQKEYWTVLKPASADDGLQAVFDRTQNDGWQHEGQGMAQRLTVKIDNFIDQNGMHILSNRRFDFNQTVLLKFTENHTTTTITLEPREVIECCGTDNAGHYVVYAKDDQWVRYDDDQVTVLSQMPVIENVRFINFAIRKITKSSISLRSWKPVFSATTAAPKFPA